MKPKIIDIYRDALGGVSATRHVEPWNGDKGSVLLATAERYTFSAAVTIDVTETTVERRHHYKKDTFGSNVHATRRDHTIEITNFTSPIEPQKDFLCEYLADDSSEYVLVRRIRLLAEFEKIFRIVARKTARTVESLKSELHCDFKQSDVFASGRYRYGIRMDSIGQFRFTMFIRGVVLVDASTGNIAYAVASPSDRYSYGVGVNLAIGRMVALQDEIDRGGDGPIHLKGIIGKTPGGGYELGVVYRQ